MNRIFEIPYSFDFSKTFLTLTISGKFSIILTYSLIPIQIGRDVHVQIIRRVFTHRTICFYSPNTLFLKVSVHQLFLSFIFQIFYVKIVFILKNTLHNRVKMNCTMCNYTPYNLYMDVSIVIS